MNKAIWNTSITIGNIKIKNRIVFPPIGTSWANPDGTAGPEVLQWYQEAAEGGCGMIVVEGSTISPDGKSSKRNLGIYDQKQVDGLKRIAETIKGNGCFASIQLLHAGGQANPEITGFESISPSAISQSHTGTGHASRAMTILEIDEIREKYIAATGLADRAGYQAVELHLAHGYLLHEFLSENTNKRTDRYGGSLANRSRLILEIISGIKQKSPDLIVGARVSGEDYLADGLNRKNNQHLLPLLEAAGLKYFSVTAGVYETSKAKHKAMGRGKFFKYSKEIKQIVAKPVIGVGKILDLKAAEEHLRNEDCDLVAIGRGLIADPKMIVKTNMKQPYNRCTECDECKYLARGRESLICPVRKADSRCS
jgi:2,4-dienoyl-CoA reductase-like NADH-dependent reductase (Old Yellow Enzyme family)